MVNSGTVVDIEALRLGYLRSAYRSRVYSNKQHDPEYRLRQRQREEWRQ
jgi:hypothetical protein